MNIRKIVSVLSVFVLMSYVLPSQALYSTNPCSKTQLHNYVCNSVKQQEIRLHSGEQQQVNYYCSKRYPIYMNRYIIHGGYKIHVTDGGPTFTKMDYQKGADKASFIITNYGEHWSAFRMYLACGSIIRGGY